MSFPRAIYRLRQFWLALDARPRPEQLEQAKGILSVLQFELFKQLQPSEQAHALDVFTQIKAAGYTDSEFLKAALLHDVGKARHPLRLWERVVIVLGKRFTPKLSERWGKGEPNGLRRPFVIAAQHPQWGAEMAGECGSSPLVGALIRYHQEEDAEDFTQKERDFLAALQEVDDKS
jgi:hypothetical protein